MPAVTVRAPTPADAEAVLAVILARDAEDIGRPDFTLDDLREEWAHPGLDLARDAWIVEGDGGGAAASGLLLDEDLLVYVHPAACGRGHGTHLRRLGEARAGDRGVDRVRQFVPASNRAAATLLRDAGYARVHHYLRLRGALDALTPAPSAPLRPFSLERDEAAVHALVQAALGEVEGFRAQTLSAWRASRIAKPGWDPALWLVLEDGEGIVGAALGERWEDGVGYVDALAVAPRGRGRGHGRTLLLGAFAAFRAAGLRTAELSVHGANLGAARLYESVGMTVDTRTDRWEKVVGDARD